MFEEKQADQRRKTWVSQWELSGKWLDSDYTKCLAEESIGKVQEISTLKFIHLDEFPREEE